MPVFFYIDPDYVRDPFLQAVFRIQIHLIRIQIQHFRPNTEPDPFPGFDDQNMKKLTAEKNYFLGGFKTTIYLSLGLHKGFSSYRRSLQPSKENIQDFKT